MANNGPTQGLMDTLKRLNIRSPVVSRLIKSLTKINSCSEMNTRNINLYIRSNCQTASETVQKLRKYDYKVILLH